MFDKAISAKLSKPAEAAAPEESWADPQQLLGLLENHLQLGMWRLNIATGELFWSRRTFQIYDRPYRDGAIDPGAAIEALISQDRKSAADLMLDAIKRKGGFEYTLRITDQAGKIKVIECVGRVELSDKGAVQAVFGTVRDVTDRALADDLSYGRSSLLRSLLKNAPAAIAVFDRNMNYLAVSDHWLAGHGHTRAGELIGKSHYVVQPHIAPEHKAEHQRVLAGEVVRSPRAYLKDRQSNTIYQVCTMAPWFTPGGEVGGMILMLPTVDQSHPTVDAEMVQAANDELPTMNEFISVLKSIA
ncbi:MAG: PAS domain-containing protein [Devosia sp.]